MIITIGRQYGSGGRELGEKLAQKLGYKFYDEELVNMAAEKSNMSSDILRMADEKATKSLLYSIVTGMDSRFLNPYYELPINDKLFIEQSNVIKSLAEEGNCVIVGRCADYVLENAKIPSVDLFVYATMEHRIERISKKYDLTKEKAKDKIKKIEKGRKTYYNYYSNREWGNIANYDLCINTSKISVDDAVDVAITFINKPEVDSI
mgnify:FL=1